MKKYESYEKLAAGTGNLNAACGSDVGKGQTFHALHENQTGSVHVENMTQAQPKVTDPSGKIQDQLNRTFIGCRQRECNEPPHVTVRTPDNRVARIEISNGDVMAGSKGDSDIVEMVQKDLKNNPNKYIKNWNDNNPDMQISLIQEKQNEPSTKDESYKDAEWYKESQQFYASNEEDSR